MTHGFQVGDPVAYRTKDVHGYQYITALVVRTDQEQKAAICTIDGVHMLIPYSSLTKIKTVWADSHKPVLEDVVKSNLAPQQPTPDDYENLEAVEDFNARVRRLMDETLSTSHSTALAAARDLRALARTYICSSAVEAAEAWEEAGEIIIAARNAAAKPADDPAEPSDREEFHTQLPIQWNEMGETKQLKDQLHRTTARMAELETLLGAKTDENLANVDRLNETRADLSLTTNEMNKLLKTVRELTLERDALLTKGQEVGKVPFPMHLIRDEIRESVKDSIQEFLNPTNGALCFRVTAKYIGREG